MPLTAKGREILAGMEKTYGPEKAKQVLYASKNAGKITGIDSAAADWMDAFTDDDVMAAADSLRRYDTKMDALCDAAETFENRVDMRLDDHRVLGGVGFTPPSGGNRGDANERWRVRFNNGYELSISAPTESRARDLAQQIANQQSDMSKTPHIVSVQKQ